MKRAPARGTLRRPAAVAVAVLVVAVTAAWLTSVPGGPGRATRVWRGYETLLISPPEAEAGKLAGVVSALGPGVVSDITAPVTFWDFTDLASVPLSRLDERIDARDPRHDPYMDEVTGLFRAPGPGGTAWRVVFVPARRPAPLDYLRVAAVLGAARRGWRLLEFDPLQALVSATGLLGLAFLLVWPRRGEGWRRAAAAAAGVLLWIPYLVCGGLARLAVCLLLYASWFHAIDVLIALQGWDEHLLAEVRGPLAVFLAQAGAGLVVMLPAGGFQAGEITALCGPVAGSVLVVVSAALYLGTPVRRRRRKFDPVRIVRPAVPVAASGQAGFLLSLVALLACAVIPLVRTDMVPSPVGVPGVRDFSWDSLRRLSGTTIAARLPDASDLVTHEAYQETLAFGRPWGMPRPDERVYVREYLLTPGGGPIVAVQRRVKVFDSAWLRASLAEARPGSIQQLFLEQERPMAVGLRSAARPLYREAPVALLVMFAMFTLLARDRRPARGRLGILAPLMKSAVVRLNGAARRNQTP